jgi:phosphoesterase RecJ-like protein
MGDFERVAEVLSRPGRVLITSHISPDGDAIGSELALMHCLRRLGSSVRVINFDPVPHNLRFLPGADEIGGPGEAPLPVDVTVLVDCGQFNRTGGIITAGVDGFGTTVNIDHHLNSGGVADVDWVEPGASSTAEMIHRLVTALVGRPDLDTACCIYTGILTDTGSFRHGNTTARVLHLAASLVERGVDAAHVAARVYNNVPYTSLQLLGRALSGVGISRDGLVAWITVTGADIEATGSTWDETEEFVNHPRSIPGVIIALCFKEMKTGEVKVSFRSHGRVDVAQIARRHGGGGHKNAAGCTIPGSMATVRSAVIEEVGALLAGMAGEDTTPPVGHSPEART